MSEVDLIELKNVKKEYDEYKISLYANSENDIKIQLEEDIKNIPDLTEEEIKKLYSIYFKFNKLNINDKLFYTIKIIKYNFNKNYNNNPFSQLDWIRVFGLELETIDNYYPNLYEIRNKQKKY
jgi:hypothetical protein